MSQMRLIKYYLVCVIVVIFTLVSTKSQAGFIDLGSKAIQRGVSAQRNDSNNQNIGNEISTSTKGNQVSAGTQDQSLEVTRYYVAKSGDGSDGSSWEKAFKQLQAALFVATLYGGGEIWVAKGVYAPIVSLNPDDARESTFLLSNNISLYGGFDTGDTKFSDRDWEKNVTVLSGDIDGNDFTDENGVVVDTENVNGKNAYNVVTAKNVDSSVVVDGFTITAGWADEEMYKGGGLYCDGSGSGNECNLKLSNIIFSGNFAQHGGAMYNDGSNGGTSNPTLTNVNFTNNKAYYGGAMYNNGYNKGTSSPSLMKITFSVNSAIFQGGAMHNFCADGTCSPILVDVIFSGNHSEGEGGALDNRSFRGIANASLTNVVFTGNLAGFDGGAMFNGGFDQGESNPVLTNVTFSGNRAGKYGGAIYNKENNRGNSNPQVRNSILWNNMDFNGIGSLSATIHNQGDSKTYLMKSLVQGSGGSSNWTSDESYVNGGSNIDSNPMFITSVDPLKAATTYGNLRLSIGSPAINAAENGFVTVETDLDGSKRIVDGIVDMGAYETLLNSYLPMILR